MLLWPHIEYLKMGEKDKSGVELKMRYGLSC